MTKLTLKPILREAWQKVSGAKRYFFVAFLALIALQGSLLIVQLLLQDYVSKTVMIRIAVNVVSLFICTPLVAGFVMLGVRRAREEVLGYKDGFAYFKKAIPLFLTQLLILISIWVVIFGLSFLAIGTVLAAHEVNQVVFLLSGVIIFIVLLGIVIVLQALFSFAFIVVADLGRSPWQAYKQSVRMAFPNLKILFLAELFFLVLDILGSIPFGIGLLWTLPFSFIATGIFYREISKNINIK